MAIEIENANEIDKATSFEEIARLRESSYLINKANGFNFQTLLSDLYTDPSHFIYELIQNAEDALASDVKIKLYEDRLVFSHNGKRLFNIDDIRAITGIGNSNKPEDDNKIGRFGIGFKAVFGVCESPKIYSGEFAFEINHLYVPHRIDRVKEYERGTYFVLPFKSKNMTTEDIYVLLYKAIEGLDADTILFLRNITEIAWEAPNLKGFYLKTKTKKTCGAHEYYECNIISDKGLDTQYLLFERSLSTNDKLFVSIAYRIKDEAGKRAFVMENASTKLVVFFPTEKETFVRFKVNGLYKTTPTRENISDKPEHIEFNKQVLRETVELYGDNLRCIKELGLMDLAFLGLLPISAMLQYQNAYAKAFYETTLAVLKAEAFLPTENGGYAKPSEALIVGSKGLTELLSEDDTAEVFGGRSKWLDSTITPTNKANADLYRYINGSLGVADIDTNAFIRTVKDKFLSSKDDEWLKKFYEIASTGMYAVKDNLNKKFIRLENGEMVAPFIGKEPNAFLPSKIKSSKTIKSVFCADKSSMAFFEEIGITTADIVEEIREFVPALKTCADENDYLENLFIIFNEYKGATSEQRKKIAEILSGDTYLLCEDEARTTQFRAKPSDAFVRYHNIQTIYEGLPSICYVANILIDKADADGEFGLFLQNIGLNTSIRMVRQAGRLTWQEKQKISGMETLSWTNDSAWQIEHISAILSTMSEKKSIALWKAIEHIPQDCRFGKLDYSYARYTNSKSFPSYFITTLQASKWLYDERDELISPSEIYYEDALKRYPPSKAVAELLEFKPDIRKTLPPDEQTRLDLTDGLPIDFIMQMREAYRREQEEHGDFVPVDVDDCAAPVTEEAFTNRREGTDEDSLQKAEDEAQDEATEKGELDDILSDILGGGDTPEETTPDEFTKKTITRTISNKSKIIGKWGEKLVFERIKKKHVADGYAIVDDSAASYTAVKGAEVVTVTHHNADDEIQAGYDITIKRGDNIEYIEVKSREKDIKQYFTVSGTQWEFAKTLALRGDGDKYCVYLVTQAGTAEAEIQVFRNPYKAWQDGKLEADPVCIKL